MTNLISVQALQTELASNPKLQLIDVRTPEKHAAFNIGGKLIPLDTLSDHLNELDKNEKIVTYCTSGGKSMHALLLLKSHGFDQVFSLDGGVTAWQAVSNK